MENLLKELREKNIFVSLNNGDLKIRYNGSELPHELVSQLKNNKERIVNYLKTHVTSNVSPGIVPVQPAPDYVLSSPQRRMVVLNRFDDGGLAYNLPGIYRFEGDLDREALFRAFQTLVERHEILRTQFKENAQGEFRQFINPPGKKGPTLIYHDLRNQNDQNRLITELLQAEMEKPFDLGEDPLLRSGLLQLAEDKWVFYYVMHHIITDGWSMGVLIRELFLLYNGYMRGEQDLLPPLRLQYKDFAAWQQRQLQEGALQAHKEYWLAKMEGELPLLELPTARPRPLLKTYRGARIDKEIPPSLAKALKELSHAQGCTLFMGLLAGVNALLYRYTGQHDMIIGTSIAGREHADLEDQIGFYINALPLRSRFSGENSFKELLQQVKEVTIEAYQHQAYPFDELVHELKLGRDTSRSPLFDVFIDFHDTGAPATGDNRQPEGLTVRAHEWQEMVVSKFDLTFIFAGTADKLQFLLEYNSQLFDGDAMERMAMHYINLLQVLVSLPALALKQAEYITTEERDNLLAFSNNGQSDPYSYAPVTELLSKQVAATPAQVAVLFNDISLTYKELDEQSNRLARHLITTHALQPGETVAIMLDRSEKMLIAIWAILKAGGAYVPVDPSYPESRKQFIITDSEATLLLTQADYMLGTDYFRGVIFCIDIQFPSTDIPGTPLAVEHKAGDLAYVIYTSGSTGQPKGCAITHGNLSHYVQWANDRYFGDGVKPVFGLCTSLSFDLTVTAIFCSPTAGGRLVVYDQYMETEEMLKHSFGENSGINSIKLTPSHINLLKNTGINAPGMLHAILGGEQVTTEHVSILKSINPRIKIYNEYGPTESTVGCVVKQLEVPEPVCIGKPAPGTRIYILDQENMLCPVGVTGEICIAGKGLAKGYLNKPALSAEKFVSDPFNEGERMYRSGDTGRWLPGGDIAFTGRKDQQVKVQGYRVEPGEIEAALKTHDAVMSAVVTAAAGVEGATELTAWFVAGKTLGTDDLRLYLSEIIPAWMMPSHFIQLEKLPLTPNGKVDRKALPDPGSYYMQADAEYVPPANETEEKLVAIWQEVLGGRIGVKDNFFDLGGNSLKLVKVVSAVNRAFNSDLAVVQLFRFPNIRALAAFMESDKMDDTSQSDNMANAARNIMEETLRTIR